MRLRAPNAVAVALTGAVLAVQAPSRWWRWCRRNAPATRPCPAAASCRASTVRWKAGCDPGFKLQTGVELGLPRAAVHARRTFPDRDRCPPPRLRQLPRSCGPATMQRPDARDLARLVQLFPLGGLAQWPARLSQRDRAAPRSLGGQARAILPRPMEAGPPAARAHHLRWCGHDVGRGEGGRALRVAQRGGNSWAPRRRVRPASRSACPG